MACQGNRLLASMRFVLLEQLSSLCSDEWSTLKNHHIFSIKELNQLRAIPTSRNVDQQSYEPVTRTARASEAEWGRSNLSAPSPY